MSRLCEGYQLSAISYRLVLALLFMLVVACRGDDPTVPAQPTAVGLVPLEGTGPSRGPAAPGPRPVPTWTLPPGVSVGTGRSGPDVPTGPSPVPPEGEVPFPTLRPRQPVPAAGPPLVDPEIVALMGRVEAARLATDVERMVAFGTRHALSPSDDAERGVGAARGWLFNAFEVLNGVGGNQVLVEYEDFTMRLARQRTVQQNVIATLPGIGVPKHLVYVTAHYDSRAEDIDDGSGDAPGADDNASGTAALLELARVLAGRRWDATIRFVAFAGSEPDQMGSKHHAPEARAAGLPILAVINNDIIGSSVGPDGARDPDRVQVFSEGPEDSQSRRLARYVQVVGERYSELGVIVVPQADREGRSGDQEPFSGAGFPAVRLTEALEDVARQHNERDTTDRLDADYHAAVVKLNLVLVANLALAPEAPEQAPQLDAPGDSTGVLRVSWEAIDDPNVAGYWVAVRGAGEQRYREVVWAGRGTELVLGGLTPGERVAIALATSDDLGHTSLFGPEATRRP